MTVKKAIDILEKQKAKIEDHRHSNDENWVFQTASYIKDFFGEDSPEFSFISQFRFQVLASHLDSDEDVRRWLSQKRIQAKTFLENCIETLQHKGLFQKPKQNFLYDLSETALWTLIPLIGTGLISVGFFFGNLYSDKQNIELRQYNKSLQDSLSSSKKLTDGANQYNKIPNTIIKKNISNNNPK